MKNATLSIENIIARNESDARVIESAKARLSDSKTTERAARLILSYLHALTSSAIEADETFVLNNVYALEKATKLIRALQFKSSAMLDKYTLAIASAMNARKATRLTNAEQNAILAASIECESLRATDKRLHKAASTATTQSSSTRVALQALNIARDDNKALVYLENEINSQFRELFKKK
jgi:hypothetical protein